MVHQSKIGKTVKPTEYLHKKITLVPFNSTCKDQTCNQSIKLRLIEKER